uniref:Uncharacterized membrane protein ycf78 n=1 Tax=Prototheca wickerhamii TaxID=3111 RepID=YCF78_PROWI|nr:RecName: Full=Uncharacterized membrane protein ycf78; AltName: Full=ycf1 [Prototheca wickerhamii]CAB53108.1 hypothetical protein [Prototheca wickerhamii]
MSLSTHIRDYVEVLTGVTEASGNPLQLAKLISESLLYVLKICQSEVLQILSFQWIRNFSLLPIKIPAIYESIIGQTPPEALFDFVEVLHLGQNPVIAGFLNSAFFALPFSAIHFVSIRRLLTQGVPAAIYSFGGYIIGQILFMSCVIFGVQDIIIPWLTLEPLNYIAGLILLSRIIISMRFESLAELETWDHPKYKNYFIYRFLIAWCEQGSIFQFLSNITPSANPTILQGFAFNNLGLNLVQNFSYIGGLLLGSAAFTLFWMWLFLKIQTYILVHTLYYHHQIVATVNQICFLSALTLSFATLPYYAYNYLLVGPLGFVPEDNALLSTVFTHSYLKDGPKELSFLTEEPIMELKLFPFNKGQYLIFPELYQTLSLEELSYRADYAWVRRVEKFSLDVTATHVGGRKLARRLGFHKLRQSFAKLILPRQTLAMDYRLELNSKYKCEDHDADIKAILDSELTNTRKESSIRGRRYRGDLSYDPTLDRFYQWYDFENVSLESSDQMMNYVTRTSVQGRFLFPQSFIKKEINLGEIHHEIGLRIKQQYNQSLIFRTLLKVDISFLLARQPKKHHLSGDQECDLQIKRNI